MTRSATSFVINSRCNIFLVIIFFHIFLSWFVWLLSFLFLFRFVLNDSLASSFSHHNQYKRMMVILMQFSCCYFHPLSCLGYQSSTIHPTIFYITSCGLPCIGNGIECRCNSQPRYVCPPLLHFLIVSAARL